MNNCICIKFTHTHTHTHLYMFMPGTGDSGYVLVTGDHALGRVWELCNTTDCIVWTSKNIISLVWAAILVTCMSGIASGIRPGTGYSAAFCVWQCVMSQSSGDSSPRLTFKSPVPRSFPIGNSTWNWVLSILWCMAVSEYEKWWIFHCNWGLLPKPIFRYHKAISFPKQVSIKWGLGQVPS